jgi:hypothetical protein
VSHRIEIRPVPVTAWTLHQPRCECGWSGDIVRTRPLAADQADEHLAEHHPDDDVVQPALFDA